MLLAESSSEETSGVASRARAQNQIGDANSNRGNNNCSRVRVLHDVLRSRAEGRGGRQGHRAWG
jgi:hypothetical protein